MKQFLHQRLSETSFKNQFSIFNQFSRTNFQCSLNDVSNKYLKRMQTTNWFDSLKHWKFFENWKLKIENFLRPLSLSKS